MRSPREQERWLLRRFLSVYDHESWKEPDADYDWVEERAEGAVEVIATRVADGLKLAIEHTLIQPYPVEKLDFARFRRFFRVDDPALTREGAFLYVDVPAGLLQQGANWQQIANAVLQCVRENKATIKEGHGFLDCVLGDDRTVRLQTRLEEAPGESGVTLIRRYGEFDVDATVRKALRTKLPKLTGTAVDRRLLMLERDQMHLLPEAIGRAIDEYRAEFPRLQQVDEIWLAETHERRRVVLFDRLRADYSYSPLFIFDGDDIYRQAHD